eukprot:2804448-Amphidinium_carterae.1
MIHVVCQGEANARECEIAAESTWPQWIMATVQFTDDLPQDAFEVVAHSSGAEACLALSCSCRHVLIAVSASAESLFAVVFGSDGEPGYKARARLAETLKLLDGARQRDIQSRQLSLHWAASFGFVKFIRSYIGQIDEKALASIVNSRHSNDGLTPLCKAARRCQFEAVVQLLEMRADVLVKDSKGFTPLFWAARAPSASSNLLLSLLEHSACPLEVCGPTGSTTPLAALCTRASDRVHRELVIVMTQGRVKTWNALNSQRWKNQCLDAAQRKSPRATRALIQACETGSATVVQGLIEAGIGSEAAVVQTERSRSVPRQQSHAPDRQVQMPTAQRSTELMIAGAGFPCMCMCSQSSLCDNDPTTNRIDFSKIRESYVCDAVKAQAQTTCTVFLRKNGVLVLRKTHSAAMPKPGEQTEEVVDFGREETDFQNV